MLTKYHRITLAFLIVVCVIVIPNDARAAAPSHIATVGNNAEATTTCEITVNVTAATNTIAVGVNGEVAITSVTDEDTNTYTQRVAETTNHHSYIYTTEDPGTNAANTITVTMSSTGDITCFGVTISGVDTADPLGNTASFSSASTTKNTIFGYSTANDDSFLVHVCGIENNGTYNVWDTDKIERDEQLNGGANKFGGAIATEETGTAGSNQATCEASKAGAFSHAIIELKSVVSSSTARSFGIIFG